MVFYLFCHCVNGLMLVQGCNTHLSSHWSPRIWTIAFSILTTSPILFFTLRSPYLHKSNSSHQNINNTPKSTEICSCTQLSFSTQCKKIEIFCPSQMFGSLHVKKKNVIPYNKRPWRFSLNHCPLSRVAILLHWALWTQYSSMTAI